MVAPYNAQVTLLGEQLASRGARVGTVDKFQGQEPHTNEVAQLHRDIASYMRTGAPERPDICEHFRQATGQLRRKGFTRERERDRGFEPER